jgi:hypothetical protein
VSIANFYGLQISYTHLSNLSAVDGEVVFPFEVAEEFGKLALYIFGGFLLLYPLRELSFDFLSIEVSTLINFLVLLLEVDCLSAVTLPHFLR